MIPKRKKPKPEAKTRPRTMWAIVRKESGEIAWAFPTREAARDNAEPNERIEKILATPLTK